MMQIAHWRWQDEFTLRNYNFALNFDFLFGAFWFSTGFPLLGIFFGRRDLLFFLRRGFLVPGFLLGLLVGGRFSRGDFLLTRLFLGFCIVLLLLGLHLVLGVSFLLIVVAVVILPVAEVSTQWLPTRLMGPSPWMIFILAG